ncbi:MAG: pyridoxal phosphate-dependent aminotransferase [Methylovulum sp.]|nr:pyridoxal phosphate-dependent aminotransferase [Methylovulum sp.]
MSKKIADRMQTISPFYVMALLQRAKQLEAEGRDVIHMEIGEPDFPTPPTIVSAGIDLLQTGEVKYTSAAGLPQLRQAIARFYQQQYGVMVAPERIFITPGASGAFLLALGISLNPGDELLMADPCYPCNSNFATLLGAIPRTLPVGADSLYQLTASQIQQHWHLRSKGVLVASPSNPTGTLTTPAALQAVIATVNALGGCFYSDEIYHGLVYGQTAVTALQYSDDVFVINSFSKYFGMTGWRIGWLVVPEEFVAVAEKLAQNIFIATSTHSQYAALAAFAEDTRTELERRRTELAARRDFLYTGLLDLGFEIPAKPEGAFYIYADASRFTDDSFQFALDFLEQEAVAITPGKDFGSHHAHRHLRFAYTTTIDNMTVALQRLHRFINKG